MAETRIYVVLNKQDGGKRLVEAASAAQAIRHCVSTVYGAEVATAKSIAQFMGEGMKIEKADAITTPRIPKKTIEQTTTAPN